MLCSQISALPALPTSCTALTCPHAGVLARVHGDSCHLFTGNASDDCEPLSDFGQPQPQVSTIFPAGNQLFHITSQFGNTMHQMIGAENVCQTPLYRNLLAPSYSSSIVSCCSKAIELLNNKPKNLLPSVEEH